MGPTTLRATVRSFPDLPAWGAMMRRVWSIRLRATVLICALIFGVVAVFAAVAYRQMTSTALATTGGQLTVASQQLAAVLATTVDRQQAEMATLSADPRVIGFLSGSQGAAAGALALLETPEAEDVAGSELRDASGRRLAATEGLPAGIPETVDIGVGTFSDGSDTTGVGPVRSVGGSLLFPVFGRVSAEGSELGSIVRWYRLSGSEVVGTGGRVYLTNVGGELWTDLNRPVDPMPVDVERLIAAPGGAEGVGESLLAGSPVPGTPWAVLVGFPLELIVGGPQRSLRGMILFGLFLLLASGGVAWMLSGRLTGSVAELASAARSISKGDYGRRTSVTGGDEIGVLGSAFNRMAGNVAEAHRQLEAKVSELAASEQTNRETRERMEHVIASSGAILYKYRIADREVTLEWVSENVKRIFGYEVEDVMRPGLWRRLRHPDDHDRFREAQNRLEAQGSATVEHRLRHADGQFRWVRDEQRLLRDADGNPREVVGVLTDVNEHRRLTGAKEAAEAANRAKNEFLSRMSHELRTPLNSVLGFGQLLELELESDANRESAQQILKAGKHLLGLIDEVLDIARIESGQLSLSVEPVSVAGSVQESLDLVRLTARDDGVTLQAGDALACENYVLADQQRLKQVLLNLLSNAIKYNRRGGAVALTCEESEERVRIVVEDTGFGIPGEKMARLFTPFERLDAEKAGVEGTGLGLALSRGLMQAMGGSLGVESEAGQGSRFWVELPVAPRPDSTDQDPAPPQPLPAASAGVTRTVLFVEDNLANVRLLERLFQRRSHLRLLTAMQGSLGLQLAREHRPDLILLDLNLPDLRGDVVLRHIRQDPDLRSIPVVMISGDAVPSQVQRLLDLGAQAYVTKPFDIQELLRVVDENLPADPVDAPDG